MTWHTWRGATGVAGAISYGTNDNKPKGPVYDSMKVEC